MTDKIELELELELANDGIKILLSDLEVYVNILKETERYKVGELKYNFDQVLSLHNYIAEQCNIKKK